MVHGQDQAQAFAKAGGRYTKKPVTIEAMRFETNNDDGTHLSLLTDWANGEGPVVATHDGTAIYLTTLEGTMRGDVGDWIIRGVKGELYPCKPEIFAATYAEARPLANRLMPADIHGAIVGESYHRVPGTTFMVCFLTLRNGYIVTGESACADPALYDQATGEKYARENAVEKVWTLEGDLLRQRLSELAIAADSGPAAA